MKVYAVYGLRIQPFPDEVLVMMNYRYGDDWTVSSLTQSACLECTTGV